MSRAKLVTVLVTLELKAPPGDACDKVNNVLDGGEFQDAIASAGVRVLSAVASLGGDHGDSPVCCERCGSLNVSYAVWYTPNDGRAGDLFGSWNAGDNTFCADCDDNCSLLVKEVDAKRFKALRRKHARAAMEEA